MNTIKAPRSQILDLKKSYYNHKNSARSPSSPGKNMISKKRQKPIKTLKTFKAGRFQLEILD